jgi:hypothetical protein
MDETKCMFVSSRGLLKSCDVHNPKPISSSEYLDPEVYSKIQSNQTVYLCTEAIPAFFTNYFPNLQVSIVIVSGDSDLSFPDDVLSNWQEIIQDSRILHWYAQNCTVQHPKVSHLPIGLDYHTLSTLENHHWGPMKTPIEQEKELIRYAQIQSDRKKREIRAYGNFLQNITRGNRKEAFTETPRSSVLYEYSLVTRSITWWKHASCVFTLSPHGNGLDCHRTWETLALGGIPVVKTSCLDPLYEGLPVLVLQSWKDFTEEIQVKALERFERTSYEKLSLVYWICKIKSHAK